MEKKRHKKNILIIHPAPASSKILGQHLSLLGHRIVWARTLKKAQGLLKKKKIHLVITSLDRKLKEQLQEAMPAKKKAKLVLIHQSRPKSSQKLSRGEQEFYGPLNLPWFIAKMDKMLARQRHF